MSCRDLARHLRCAFLLAILLLGGCNRPRAVVDQPLPERDLVYQTSGSHGTGYQEHVGFVNVDGSGQILLTITTNHISPAEEPVWTPDGDQLLFYDRLAHQLVGITKDATLREYAFFASEVAPVAQAGRAVLSMGYDELRSQIALFDLDGGVVLRTFAIEDDNHLRIGANALAGSQLVFMRWRQPGADPGLLIEELVVLDVDSGAERILLRREGRGPNIRIESPAVSPDGQWIAYTLVDGLYLIRPDGSDQHRLLPLDLIRYDSMGPSWYDWAPAPSWSPDSRWLVYSRCTVPGTQSCDSIAEDYAIFKLNIETQEEVLLVEGGVNPYWRLAPGARTD